MYFSLKPRYFVAKGKSKWDVSRSNQWKFTQANATETSMTTLDWNTLLQKYSNHVQIYPISWIIKIQIRKIYIYIWKSKRGLLTVTEKDNKNLKKKNSPHWSYYTKNKHNRFTISSEAKLASKLFCNDPKTSDPEKTVLHDIGLYPQNVGEKKCSLPFIRKYQYSKPSNYKQMIYIYIYPPCTQPMRQIHGF